MINFERVAKVICINICGTRLFFGRERPKMNLNSSSPCRAFSVSADSNMTTRIVFAGTRRSPIVGLFNYGRPSAIFWLIVTVVVNAIQLQPGRSISHIAEKVSEVSPAITYSNPPTSVVFPRFVVGVTTATNHASPAIVGRSSRISMLPVGSFSSRQRSTVAAATYRPPSDGGDINNFPVSARTVAHNSFVCYALNDGQLTVLTAYSKSFKCCHSKNYTPERILSHG